MPTIRPNAESGERRTTFRPPWVKDVPPALPAPPPAWVGKQQEPVKTVIPPPNRLKLGEAKNIKISIDGDQKSGPNPSANKVKANNYKPGPETSRAEVGKGLSKEQKPSIPDQSKKEAPKEVQVKVNKEVKKPDIVKKETPFGEVKLRKRSEDVKREEPKTIMATPPPPPPPPSLPPAPPPPPPPSAAPPGFVKQPMTEEKAQKLEALRSRARRRPDWTDMMKEVETGIKLKKVKCNDRSAPIIPKEKAKGQFVYESEKENAHNPHNQLLKEIQGGVQLKKVKTNDRSKPILQGLRKFRRQMTIEEQIQKSASVADVIAVAAEPDELDDIDKVRDDLQSTKQMLALELRNKEALERENKRLMARLLNLEVELEKEKLARKMQSEGSSSIPIRTAEDEKLISKLKEEASEATKITKEMEDKYHKTAEELDYTRAKLESAWLRNTQLEMELKSKGTYDRAPLAKQPSSKKLARAASNVRQPQQIEESESEGSDTETEGEYEDEDGAENNNAEKTANREQRELKLLTNKLKAYKEKRMTAIKEKRNYKGQLSKLQSLLREERKKYRVLQKEVDKMAALLKDVDEDEEKEEDDEEDDEDDEEEETETESESDDDDGAESEGDLPEDAAIEDKIANLNRRIKSHEAILQRAKKGNYLLKANIDRRQDDLNRQKEMSLSLQEDLNAVLSELG